MADSGSKRILFIFGTRPEAIKLSPLIASLRASSRPMQVVVCVSGQHREMLHQVLQVFAIEPDLDLDLMTGNQSLNQLSARLLHGLDEVLGQVEPALTVVQGDTTTALCGALASFHRHIPVAHVEAGLRTHDVESPFPEESNRVLTDRLARLYFAATTQAAENLLAEGVPQAQISITGNTGIDAILAMEMALDGKALTASIPACDPAKRLVLVTAHRRESFGAAFDQILSAVAALALRDDVQIVWPVHPNPNIHGRVYAALEGRENVLLCEPLDYLSFVDLLCRCYFVLTDSGGIQEEAPSLGKPVLVLRENTERPEGIGSGSVKLVGTNQASIVQAAHRLLDDSAEYARMAKRSTVYGDGHASQRIAQRIEAFLFSAPEELT